jgi:hypothetical protein
MLFLLTKGKKKLYNYIMSFSKYLLKGSLVVSVHIFLLIPGLLPNAIGKDTMEIKRDENKTVYSIGSSQDKKDGKTEDEKDKDRAWDMLKHMNIIIDQRNQGGQQPNGQ